MVGGDEVAPGELEAVVSLGGCSGVLVEPDLVLTSAHCLRRPIKEARIAGREIRVSRCEAHPEHRTLRLEHDFAVCKLAHAVSVPAIPIDDAPISDHQAVVLAGYGATGPLAHDGDALRRVRTSTHRGSDGRLVVGTPEHTACWGDSGGPVLVAGDKGLRVVGILHGPIGAICASSSEAVFVRSERDWLDFAMTEARPGRGIATAWRAFGAVAIACAVLAAIRWSRRTRNVR